MATKGELILISASSSRGLTIVVWVLQVLTGCLFLFAGGSKLFGVAEMVSFFAQVGFGQWLRYFLGVLEVGSAVALFFPRQAFYGAVVLSVSLVGHIVIHAAVLRRPAVFLVFLLAVTLLIAYLRRPSANA
jgi:putative oxidoreductase